MLRSEMLLGFTWRAERRDDGRGAMVDWSIW